MAARVFVSYSHRDEELRDQLEVQLAMLKRQKLIEIWHDRRLLPGDQLDWTISKELDQADIVLLLISPDFLASDYCYKIEKGRALERHREGTAQLVSVIMRPCDWKHTDLAEYLVTPTDGKPVTLWPNIDEAFLDVAKSIRRAIEEIGATGETEEKHSYIEKPAKQPQSAPELPRSSNLRLRKKFTEADKDRFLVSAFEYMDRFFQGSLSELQVRNDGIETRHRKVDGNTFTATIYRGGAKIAACSIRLGGILGNEIAYSEGDAPINSYNESITVENDDQKLFLRPMGMPNFGLQQNNNALSEEGAAEYYWSLLISPLQGTWEWRTDH